MDSTTLYRNFHQSLTWNGLLYLAQQLITISLTFLLYGTLTTELFTTWASINSITFLIVLWSDCGLRRSVPRFYATYHTAPRSFIKFVSLFRFTTLALALAGLWGTQALWNTYISIPAHYLWYCPALIVTHGIISLIQTFYHAQFLNRFFNLLLTSSRFIQLIIAFVAISYHLPCTTIISITLGANLVTGIALIIIGIRYLPLTNSTTSLPIDVRAFMSNSLMIWLTTIAKSLSERNLLLLIVTALFGQSTAALFKIAQASALFFQRTLLKTIGTADTSFLSFADQLNTLSYTYAYLANLIRWGIYAALTVLLCICGASFFFTRTAPSSLFIIMTIGYLLELNYLTYERLAEVKSYYMPLLLGYSAYCVLYAVLIYSTLHINLQFIWFITILSTIRLLGLFIIAHLTTRNSS